MEQAEAIVTHRGVGLPISVCARLRQGSSTRATVILQDTQGGTTLTVGADPTCDWQIRAAFVPPHAFSLRLCDGEVQVQSGKTQSVLLNGKLLGDGWTRVPHGARIDVGLARVEVSIGPSAAWKAAPPSRVGSSAARWVDPRPRSDWRAPLPPRSQAAREYVPPAVLVRDPPEQSGEFEIHGSRAHGQPALLERSETRDSAALRRYALVGVVTACAYGGWLALLDFL